MLKNLFHIALLIPVSLNSQINIINRSLTDSTLNYAYVGVGNTIELRGYKGAGKLNFSTTNGTLMNFGQTQYVLQPFKLGDCTVTFYDNRKKIASRTFKAETLGDPDKRFGRQYDSVDKKNGYTYYIAYKNLMSDPTLKIEIPNCYFRNPWKIVSYHITLDSLSGGQTISEFTVRGAEPTEEHLQMIKRYGPNIFMTIDEIRVTGPDGRIRKLTPMILIVR